LKTGNREKKSRNSGTPYTPAQGETGKERTKEGRSQTRTGKAEKRQSCHKKKREAEYPPHQGKKKQKSKITEKG